MKASKHRAARPLRATAPLAMSTDGVVVAGDATSLPAAVASMFTRLRLAHRVRLLRRLLMPVGPMALTVLAGGVFAKYAAQARWTEMAISPEDAANVTWGQVFELVRYVEQSSPEVLQQVLVALVQDPMAVAAVGASVAAIAFQRLSRRRLTRAAGP